MKWHRGWWMVLILLVAWLLVAPPIKLTVNQPIARTDCACPPALTPEQEAQAEKDYQCEQFRKAFLSYFGGLPYDPCKK